MDKAAVIERYKSLLNQLDEPARNVVLSSGSALVMLGIRQETADLDVGVVTGMFRFLVNTGKFPMAEEQTISPNLTFAEDVEIHECDEDRGLCFVDGVWLYSPNELLIQKRYLASLPGRKEEKREADLRDISALESLVKEQKHTARAMA